MATTISVLDSSNTPVTVATLDAIAALVGEVQASPTSNTLLDRVKALATLIGEVQASPTSNTVLDRLKTIATAVAAATPAGTNLIGSVKVDQTTQGTTNLVVADMKSGVVYDDAGNKLTVKYATIAASSSGNNNLVAAVTSKKIRVLSYTLMVNGAVNVKFQSDGAGTPVDKTGLKYFDAAGRGIAPPFNPHGWFETGSGKTLDLNLSAAVAVGGELVYVEVP